MKHFLKAYGQYPGWVEMEEGRGKMEAFSYTWVEMEDGRWKMEDGRKKP